MSRFLLLCFLPLFLIADTWEEYKQKVLLFQKAVPGWCTEEKASQMMDLIYEIKPQVCVEIGVFGGSSAYPTAAALKFMKSGLLFGIDPWSAAASTDGYSADDANYQWWSQIDYNKIYMNYLNLIRTQQLEPFCATYRMSSLDAIVFFQDESIDILHIDGNHSEESALRDAVLYFPKVKMGGYIWFDDVNWNTTAQAVSYLLTRCNLLLDRSIGNECFLFQKSAAD